MSKLSVVLPAYNEELMVGKTCRVLAEVLTEAKIPYELVVVNDGSGDRTWEEIQKAGERDANVTGVLFSRNFGKEAAMYAGFCNVTGDYVAVMDADMQDPPALLPEMLDKLLTGEYDSVATCRVTRKGEPPIRSWFARLFYRMINRVSDADIVDGARDFRLMRREMVDAIVEMGEYNRFSKGSFCWIGFRTCWLPYENVNRVAGETKWNFWKLFKYAIDGIINFSQAPLAFASWFGMFMTVLSFVAVIFIIIRKLVFGDPVTGWASTACIITFIGGVQLFCMGIMGQYIAKTYLEVKKRPHYIVAESNMDEVKRIK